MKKRIAIAVILALAIAMFICIVEVKAQRETEERREYILETAEDLSGTIEAHTNRVIASCKSMALAEKENREAIIRDKRIQRNIRRLEAERERERLRAEEEARKREANREPNYSGAHLTRTNGVFYYGNQRETYYNLPMEGVVARARHNGIGGEYWVRSDGCKMLGDYIIIATNWTSHPYGSLVETSLGIGISLDTGGFASWHPLGVDIATNW